MSLLDLFVILVAVLIFFLAHTALWLTVVLTIVVLIVERLLIGQRIP